MDKRISEDFEIIKKKIMVEIVLQGPEWNLPFQIHLDSLDKEIGVVLGKQEEKETYAIYYLSKNLVGANLNYTVIEKEFLEVVHVVDSFMHYIIGYQVFLHTDHAAIWYLLYPQ